MQSMGEGDSMIREGFHVSSQINEKLCVVLRQRTLLYPSTAVLLSIILVVIFHINSLAPFGGGRYSLAAYDANIQYLDFFAYLKDVLEGKNNIQYTFSKGLGGNGIALFSYYLSSPLNIIVGLWGKSQLNSVFDVLVLLKICLSGFFMAVYLDKRFRGALQGRYVIVLSISYALMQFNVVQANNIMWLDGVYMLPLLALGVFYCVRHGRIGLLSISVFFTIIFNWYSGAINGILTILIFICEMVVSVDLYGTKLRSIRYLFSRTCSFFVSGMIGIGLSSFLFLPTILELQKGRGSLDLSTMPTGFFGNPIGDLQGFVYGAQSTIGQVSLFVGAFALFGFIGFFTSSYFSYLTKGIVGVTFGILWLSFHWKPLFFVFSLLKDASSYWYRYSYTAIFVIIAVAAAFYLRWGEDRDTNVRVYVAFCVFLGLILLLDYVKPVNPEKNIMYTIIFSVIIVSTIVIDHHSYLKQGNSILSVLLVIMCCVDLGYNSKIDLLIGAVEVQPYRTYVLEQEKQISKLRIFDQGIYRISQTSTRNEGPSGLTANYNEGLAYDYQSLTSYSSDPDNAQRSFFDELGYPINGENYNIVNMPILPVDSLLGAKYVLSPTQIEGLTQLSIPSANGKKVYSNPFALPVAFLASTQSSAPIVPNENPFDYQDELYSALLGRKVVLYNPVPVKMQTNGGRTTYSLSAVPRNRPVYGLLGPLYTPSTLHFSGNNIQAYSQWGAPKIFYVPQNDDGNISMSLSVDDNSVQHIPQNLFYSLDLEELQRVTDDLRNEMPKIEHWHNGDVALRTKSARQRELVTSIIADPGWKVSVDGKPVRTRTVSGALLSIPVDAGEHTVTMKYVAPGMVSGLLTSTVAALVLIPTLVISGRRKKQNSPL